MTAQEIYAQRFTEAAESLVRNRLSYTHASHGYNEIITKTAQIYNAVHEQCTECNKVRGIGYIIFTPNSEPICIFCRERKQLT